MPRPYARTRPADLRFHVYDRSVHPELYTALRRADIVEPAYRAVVAITGQSHLVAARAGRETITEVLAPPDAVLPRLGVRSSMQISRASQDEVTRVEGALHYHGAYRVEAYTPAEMRDVVAALLERDRFERLKMFFDEDAAADPALDAAGFAPFTLIDFHRRPRRLDVKSIHAYPHELQIVYVETRIDVAPLA
jgi:hypothetical protein